MRSTIALTDSNGSIKTLYNYDPNGNTAMTGVVSENPFQYAGRENDGTGLYYYRARYYNPEIRRFISEDPLKVRGRNYYIYVDNNPVNRIDPTGNVVILPGSGDDIPWAWDDIYGNCCGWNRDCARGERRAWEGDPVDKACENHDKCMRAKCPFMIDLFGGTGCRECNQGLCRDLSNLQKDPCQKKYLNSDQIFAITFILTSWLCN